MTKVMDQQMEWQLEHPTEGIEECRQYLRDSSSLLLSPEIDQPTKKKKKSNNNNNNNNNKNNDSNNNNNSTQ